MSLCLSELLLSNLQWFGNLVTMQWWNDLWLNEGFASFVENVGVDFTNPEWKMMDQFYLDKFQTSMALDQLSNSHPIMAEVKDPAQINSLFDTISYDKVNKDNVSPYFIVLDMLTFLGASNTFYGKHKLT